MRDEESPFGHLTQNGLHNFVARNSRCVAFWVARAGAQRIMRCIIGCAMGSGYGCAQRNAFLNSFHEQLSVVGCQLSAADEPPRGFVCVPAQCNLFWRGVEPGEETFGPAFRRCQETSAERVCVCVGAQCNQFGVTACRRSALSRWRAKSRMTGLKTAHKASFSRIC
jgi:hypothetical protein